MAARQQSFFDQTHQRRPRRPQWRPNNTYHPNPQYTEPKPPPPKPKPPIPASSRSRAKLQVFTFVETPPEDMVNIQALHREADKENVGPGSASRKSQDDQGRTSGASLSQQPCRVNTPRPDRQSVPPQTPGISLEDLLDDNHDSEPSPPKSTPKDQVGWEHTRIPSQKIPITPSLHRGKKRPRSESPTSSSRSDEKEGLDNRKLQALASKTPIRTPRYDPGPEIWNRYVRNDLATPSRPPASANADMLHSSPQDPFVSASRNYRRVASDLTHTARKRRRVDKNRFGRGSQVMTGMSSDAPPPRVTLPLLMEKLKEFTETSPLEVDQALPEIAQLPSSLPLPNEFARLDDIPNTSQQMAELAMSDGLAGDLASSHQSQGTQSEQHIDDETVQNAVEGEQMLVETPPSPGSGHASQRPLSRGGMLQPLATSKRKPGSPNVNGFSDFDIDEDELLSTCIQLERVETTQKQSSHAARTPEQHFEPDGANDTIGRSEHQQQADGPRNTHRETDRSIETGDASELEFDEFDADDMAEVELQMSKYDNSLASEAIHPELTKMNRPSDLAHDMNDNDLTTDNNDENVAQAKYGEAGNPVDLIDDEFADEDLEDAFAELVNDPSQKTRLESNSDLSDNKPKTIQRYLVKDVQTGFYSTDRGFKRPEMILSVEDEKTKTLKVVLLRDAWCDSPATPGSYVHVLAEFNREGQCVIDNEKGIFVLHPDHLVSATVVADSFKCIRRAVLQDRVKATNEASQPQVYGHILHEIFQEALKENSWEQVALDKIVRDTAEKFLESLFEINVDLEAAVTHLKGKMIELKTWAATFVSMRPGNNATVRDRNGGKIQMSINKLLDVEEHIWSPMYGLKGNVDATVQVVMKDGKEERTLTVPLELKTGKNTSNESHRAQTALYTLLMSDRYDIEVTYGILYYLEASEMSRIRGVRLELLHMIKQRNELATYVRDRLALPPMLKKERDCKWCYAQKSCFTYHKLSEDGDGDTSGLGGEFVKNTQHLLPQHQEFFKKWDHLLTKEESDMMKFRRELWTMTSAERQKVGRCFARLVIEPGSAGEVPGAHKINRYKYSFVQEKSSPSFTFTESQITTGEPIVISDEQGHYALANGYVTSIRKNRITVAVDRRLHNARTRSADFDAVTNQSFAGIMSVDKSAQVTSADGHDSNSIVYRLDKDEFSSGMATVRNNLLRLMEKDLFGAQQLRRLVIDKDQPRFLQASKQVIRASAALTDLNVDQRAAIEKVMTARDYALVLGMPGTGKTTTIAHIIRALASQGKSVLLTSYTHTAVDNILLKIRDDKISVLRIGTVAKVHPEVAEFADLAAIPKTDAEELKKSYNSQVVATTCLGVNHAIFSQRVFDYCIVDEASQITLPVCLGPIRMAKTFILVGDHFQLPPLVQNKEALEGGLDVSLFKYLSDAHGDSVVNLEHQYRMCAEIMSLSNELIYNGRLKCGNESVASRRLVTPSFGNLAHHHHSPATLAAGQMDFCLGPKPKQCWLFDALRPESPVVFLNTDPLGDIAKEQAHGSRIVNQAEVKLCTQLVTALLSAGIGAQELGVITLYRSQLSLMRQELKVRSTAASAGAASANVAAEVEMHTADKYQGRDKEAIVLSLVRSNDANNVGDLLKDWRRVNVALTRARTKLIIVGSWKTMQSGNELLNHLCNFVQNRGWRYDLNKGACQDHYFEDFITQGTAQHAVEPPKHAKIAAGNLAKRSPLSKIRPPSDYADDKENLPLQDAAKRLPPRRGRLDPGRILGRRPVLRNILDNSLSAFERDLIGFEAVEKGG